MSNFIKINERIFFKSSNVNIFPCSRRGHGVDEQHQTKFYDPEARLNTERTNRLHTAVNGFNDSFIRSFENNTLTFVLAGYYIEVKNFVPSEIADSLGISADDDKIYAHLSLHDQVSLRVTDYFTEILYRQSRETNDANSLDVTYEQDDFFVGVSFTSTDMERDSVDGTNDLAHHNLQLFSKSGDNWELVQTSLLPHIEHGDTADSIKVIGKITTLNLDVDTNIDTDTLKASTEITTPRLTTNDTNTEIVVDRVLKVNTINSDSANGLTVKQAAKLEKTLTVEGATTIKDTLTVEKLVATKLDEGTGEDKGEVKTPQLRVNRITSDTGTITIDNKDLVVNNKKVSAKEVSAKVVAADKITQNGNPIPAIALSEVSASVYRLQITLDASKQEQN